MISAIILAAGKSTRMGSPKMLLPWGDTTIIEHAITIFAKAGIGDILIVTGGAHQNVETILAECRKKYPVRSVFSENHVDGDMLSSIKVGLQTLALTPLPLFHEEKGDMAALIGLGDQPQVQERSVRLLCEAYQQTKNPIIVPSFQMHRGHPWLIARSLWDEVIRMDPSQTPRDFLNDHAHDIHYVNVDNPSILADIDTPEAYQASRP